MTSPHHFDDAATESLLAGNGVGIDGRLAELIVDMRTAYTSAPTRVSAELASLLSAAPAAAASLFPPSRRLDRLRGSTLAKIAAAAASVMAATGGLAVANALPAPLQDAMSHLGVGAPAGQRHSSAGIAETTTSASASSTTVSSTADTISSDDHGKIVSTVAQDHSDGCDHGADVSQVASDGHSNNTAKNGPPSRPCETTTTVATDTPTSLPDGHDGRQDNNNPRGQGQGAVTTSPTTAGPTGAQAPIGPGPSDNSSKGS